jgi:hypothetical protein
LPPPPLLCQLGNEAVKGKVKLGYGCVVSNPIFVDCQNYPSWADYQKALEGNVALVFVKTLSVAFDVIVGTFVVGGIPD